MNLDQMILQLKREQDELRAENAELRRLLVLTEQRNDELQKQLGEAQERIGELEGSKKGPPGFVKANKPKAEGNKAPRRKRASVHNQGRRRAKAVTCHEEHRIEQCPACKCNLRKKRVAWKREVIDLPEPQPIEVTEHAVYKGYCPHCASWKYAAPYESGAVVGQRRFGTRLMALIGYLRQELRLPVEAIRTYLETLHGLGISAGSLVNLCDGLAQSLRPQVEQLQKEIRSSTIVHADETGWRENGQNGYIWHFGTPGPQGVRSYQYEHSRGQQVVEDFLGQSFQGVLVSDFYGSYNVYRGPHQRCWVHLLRDLHELKEKHPDDKSVQQWAQELRALYDRAQDLVRAGTAQQAEREKLYGELISEVQRLGLIHARQKHPCRALAKRVLRHQDELFQFVLVAELAADNNLAERCLRPLVVVRKISGGTRSPKGSQTRMILASIFATLRAQELNPYRSCLDMIRANF